MAREYKVVRVEIDADRLAGLCRRLDAAELRGHPRNVDTLREMRDEAGLGILDRHRRGEMSGIEAIAIGAVLIVCLVWSAYEMN